MVVPGRPKLDWTHKDEDRSLDTAVGLASVASVLLDPHREHVRVSTPADFLYLIAPSPLLCFGRANTGRPVSQSKLSVPESILLEEHDVVSALPSLSSTRERAEALRAHDKVARWPPRQRMLKPRHWLPTGLQHAVTVVHTEHTTAKRSARRGRDGGDDKQGAVPAPGNAREKIVVGRDANRRQRGSSGYLSSCFSKRAVELSLLGSPSDVDWRVYGGRLAPGVIRDHERYLRRTHQCVGKTREEHRRSGS